MVNLSIVDGFSLSDELPFTPGSSGWLPDWVMRKRNPIGGTTAGWQFNYQMKITVHKGSGTDSATDVYCNGHCRDDFGDIRWTRAGGLNLLDHWMESYTSGVSAVFWVEVPFVPKSPGTINQYMYYDKSDATSISNGANTFYFWDDFEDGDISDWTALNGTWSVNGDKRLVNSNAGRLKKGTVPDDFVLDVDVWEAGGSTGGMYVSFRMNDAQADTPDHYNFGNLGTNWYFRKYTKGTNTWSDTLLEAGFTANTAYHWTIKVLGSNFEFFVDDVKKGATITDASFTSGVIGAQNHAAALRKWDNFRVRKYASPEPAWGSWGVQEIYEALVDALSLADAISTQLISAFKEISLTDGYTLADIVSIQEALYRTLTDSFSLADVSSTQEIYYRSLTDGHALADPLTIFRARLLSLVDGHDLADVLSTQETFYRLLTDGYTLADPITALRTRLLSLLDGHVLVDTTITQEIYARLFTDAYSLADPFTALRARLLSLVDGHRLTDVPSTQEIFYRALADAYQLADPVTVTRARILSLLDGHTLADIITTMRSRLLSVTDGYSFADILSTQEVLYRALTDAYGLADIVARQEIFYRSLVDPYAIADTTSTLLARRLLLTDFYQFADPVSLQRVFSRLLTDAYGLADILTLLKAAKVLTLTDAFSLADAIGAWKYYIKEILLTDAFTLADVYSFQRVYSRLILEGYSLADILLRIGPIINQPISDAFSLADPITHLGEYGLDFDGNEYVDTTNDVDWSAITLSAWVKFNDFTADKYIICKTKTSIAADADLELELYTDVNDLVFNVRDAAGQHVVSYPVSNLNTTDFFHIVAVADDPNNTLELFVNGASVATGTMTVHNNLPNPFRIGSRGDGLFFFNGVIDEVHIYDRALSADEIRELAAKRKPTLDPNSVGLWHMDENGGSGDLVVDASPNRNHGRRKPTYPTDVPDYVWTGDKPIPLAIQPDAFSLFDILLRIGPIINQPISDAFSLYSISTQFHTRIMLLTDAFAFLDALSAQETFFRTIVDPYTLADPLTVLRSRLISLADNYSLADVLATRGIVYRSITDGYSFADAPSTQEIFYRALVDAYQLADPIATLRFRLLAISDGYALADITSVQEVHNRLITDFYNLADPITSLKFKLLGITDGYSLADVYSKQGVYNRLITDAFSFRDRLLRGAFIKAFLTDAYALSDLRSVIKNPIVVEKLILKLIRLIDLQGR